MRLERSLKPLRIARIPTGAALCGGRLRRVQKGVLLLLQRKDTKPPPKKPREPGQCGFLVFAGFASPREQRARPASYSRNPKNRHCPAL